MRRQQFLRFLMAFVLPVVLLFACRKAEEETPTPAPTAIATTAGGRDLVVQPSPTPILVPTATPEPERVVAVDPDKIDWPPQVVFSSPAPGEESLLDGAITIRFDQAMDQDSVEEAFVVQSLDDEGGMVAGTFSWPRPDTLIFSPQTSLKRQQNYRVNIGQRASSAKGFPLDEPLELYLQTVGYLEVSQVIPENGVRGIDTDSAITVLFNRPVVPLVSTAQQASLPQPLLIEPAASGQGSWVSTSIYRFVPDAPLAGDTTYEVRVSNDFEDVTGSLLEREFVWRFATVGPDVLTIEPENGEDRFLPTRPITITFNMPMNRASVESAVSVQSEDAPAVSLDFEWSDGDRVLQLTPRQSLRLSTSYQIGIAQSARSASGEATLESDVFSGFATLPLPAVQDTRPVDGGVADRWQRGFTVNFTAPMDWSTLEGRVRIEPEPGEVEYNFYGLQLSVAFESLPNRDYVVTIPGDASDPYGNRLGRDYTWRFSTAPGEPIASLNLPGLVSQLSTSFASQVDIIHRNVSRLDVTLHQLGLPLNILSAPYTINDYRPATAPDRSWSLELTTPPEQADIVSLPLADGGTLPTGVYLLSISAPESDQNARYWQNQRNAMIVADTNVVVKEMFGEVRVWTTEIASGQPAPGRNLVAYNSDGAQIGSAISDVDGFARLPNPAEDRLAGVTVVSNLPGEVGFGLGQSEWNPGVSPWEFGVDTRSGDESPVFAYVYTDRPIYRPGDTVYYKGIVRDANYGRYAPPSVNSVELTIAAESFFIEEGIDETFTVNLDESGIFNGEYTIPEEASLGTYQLAVTGQEYEAIRRFSVAEYRKPEFLVSLTPEEPEVLRGQSVGVTLEAGYFFGGPATDVSVNWSVYEQAYYLDVPGPFYQFGDGGDFFYRDYGPFGPGGSFLGNYLVGGNGVTDGEGRLTITLPADLLEEVEEGSRLITVEAQVSDLANFPVSSRTTVVLHAAEAYVGIAATDYFATAGRSVDFDLLTVDWGGSAQPNQDVEVVFYRREWERERSSDFGMYITNWKPVDTEVDRTRLTTNGQGRGSASFVPDGGGTFLAVATVRDAGGRTQTSSTIIWVADTRYAGWRSDPKARKMDLVADQQAYRPGDTARILVQSPFSEPVRAWLTIERGTLIEQRLITLQGSSDLIEIPIAPIHAPNVFVSITAVKGVNLGDPDNPYADIRLGIVELVVSPEQLGLQVEMTPQAEFFSPGESAMYDIRVTDSSGRPVQAEFSVALVDLAVLTLKEDNAPPILDAFYARQPYRSVVGSGLFVSGEGLEVEIPVEPLGLGGGGGGGFAEDVALSRAAGDSEDEDIRRDFPDTAYWQAVLRTGANGQASIEIPLPDSLTTWRLSAKAWASPAPNEMLVGQSTADVVVTLPLLIRPVTPRFLTAGDRVQIGSIVNNNSGQDIEATVSLDATGLVLHDPATRRVTVSAGGRQHVQWQALVGDVPSIDLVFRVEGGGYRDATRPTLGVGPDNLIPVYRYTAEDIVGTSGELSDAGRRVEAFLLPAGVDLEQGEVLIDLSPSLAAALVEALEYNNDQEYIPVCAHALSDRLMPNVSTLDAIQALGLDNQELTSELMDYAVDAVSQLESLQKADGGWGWCYSAESSPWLTAYTMLSLIAANDAGVVVNTGVLDGAGTFLRSALNAASDLPDSWSSNRQAFFLYVLAEGGNNVIGEADQLFSERRSLLDPYARALLAMVLHAGGNRNNQVQALLSDLSNSAQVSATGAHWQDADQDYGNLNSDVRGTAIVIEALTQIDPRNVLLPQAVRWLMIGRQAEHWSSGHETAWSIRALADWMVASGELQADYEYALNVNTTPLAEGSFTPDTVTESKLISLPLGSLVPEEINYLDFQRGLGSGRLYYTMHIDSYLNAESVQAVSRGISIERAYYDASCNAVTDECAPINSIEAGQRVRVELNIVATKDLLYAVIEDPLPAGAEAIDPGLETSASGLGGGVVRTDLDYAYGYWGWWYFNRIEYRDEKVMFLAEYLPAGTYQYTYYLQTNIAGEYQVRPAVAVEEFFPDVFGRSDGMVFTINE